MTTGCRVFISYAHAPDEHGVDEHADRVRDLWIFLRANGIDAKLDRVAAQRRQDWPIWMGDQVREADHILVIASEAYRKRAEVRAASDEGRGVQWEARLIRDAFYRDQQQLDRFLPVVLPGESKAGVPDFLGPWANTVYYVRDFTLAGAEPLLRLLWDKPAEVEPALGAAPDFGSLEPRRAALRHDVALYVDAADSEVRGRTELAGTDLGERTGALPSGLREWHRELASASGGERLAALGQALWAALVPATTGRQLAELIDLSPVGSVVDIVVHLADEVSWLPVELLRLPDGRLLATIAGVRVSRRLVGVERAATPPLAGPLKILAAVAAPDETSTGSAPLDVEAEMQALLDAVTGLDLGERAQVRILEVASLPEIGKALAADQYHVLHLSAHGSTEQVELEDEDGKSAVADSSQLVGALRAGRRPLPLVVLSSCRGAETGAAGLAATLVRHGADRVIAMQSPVTDAFATDMARELYAQLAAHPAMTVAQALADARRFAVDRQSKAEIPHPSEASVPTLICGGDDLPLRDASEPAAPLTRATAEPGGVGIRELPLGRLIGRRAQVRTAMAVLRASAEDRERVGDWAGVQVTGIGGIGKTAIAGRVLARAREHGWAIAEHVGAWNPSALIGSVAAAHPHPAFSDPNLDDTTKMNVVLDALRDTRLVLLFDDFEQNLTPEGQFTDPGFAELFAIICRNAESAKILVTCRYPIPDAEPTLLRIDVPSLSPAEQGRLFLRLKALRSLSNEDRRVVIRTIGGHPRLIEFLDVLLRHGTAADLRHITAKLHNLANAEHLNPTPARDLTTGITDAIRLGSRDILLDILTKNLTPAQHALALQTALFHARFTRADLAHTRHGPDFTPAQLAEVAGDAERLRDLTLLTTAPDDQLVMHPWVRASLNRHQHGENLLIRHRRGAAMRLHRLNTDHGDFDDIVDHIRHVAGHHDYDTAVAGAFEACEVAGGEIAVSALLAEIVPLIPTAHARYLAIADRECDALRNIGLTGATIDKLHHLHAIAQERAAADPGNARFQRDLSVFHNKVGDLAVARGDSVVAEEHFRSGLAIAERLAAADPGNAEFQRDLSISHNKLGDLAVARGDSVVAEGHFRSGLAIRERLAAADPGNAGFQRDLSVSHERLGGLAVVRGDSVVAEEHFRSGLAIRERLAAADPGNAEFQRDLSVSHSKLGGLAVVRGDSVVAEEHFRSGLAIAERLAAADPGNAEFQRDLSISHERLGGLAVAGGDLVVAEEHFRSVLVIRERLAAADPGNAGFQRDLGVFHDRLGGLAVARGDLVVAEGYFRSCLVIAERLAAADPSNVQFQRDLSISRANMFRLASMTEEGDEPG